MAGHHEVTQSLHDAVRSQDRSAVVRHLSFPGSLVDGVEDETNDTALLVAARQGVSADIVEILIAKGAQVNHQNTKLKTALILAAEGGFLDLAKLLLSNGADVNVQCSIGSSALLAASARGHLSVVQTLLEHGASQNVVDVFTGRTPLLAATRYGYFEVAELLLSHCADPNDQSCKKESVLINSILNDCSVEFVERLLGLDVNVDACSEFGTTALIRAAVSSRVDVMKVLLKAGASVDQADDFGVTALLYAAHSLNFEGMQVLLDHGADINKSCLKGQTAFSIACHYITHESIDFFLSKNVNIHHLDSEGCNAVYHAASVNNSQVVSSLLEKGVSANILNKISYTPLMIASQLGFIETVNVLLEGGVDVNQVGKGGRSALLCAAYCGRHDVVKALLAKSADIEAVDDGGRSVLILACLRDSQTALHLISNGAAVGKTDNQGMTAMHRAAERCDDDVVRALVKHGADPNLRNVNGDTPLWMAVRNMRLDSIPIIGALVEGGAEFYDELHKLITIHHRTDDMVPTLIVQAMVLHGADPSQRIGRTLGLKQFSEKLLTPFQLAILNGWTRIAKFFIINSFLHTGDVGAFTSDPDLKQYMACKGFGSCLQLLSSLYSQPWTLRTQSFLALSSSMGSGSTRRNAVRQTVMPPCIKRGLLFDNANSKLDERGMDELMKLTVGEFLF